MRVLGKRLEVGWQKLSIAVRPICIFHLQPIGINDESAWKGIGVFTVYEQVCLPR